MKTEARWKKALRYLGRALILNCPVCGKSPIFPPLHCTRTLRDWFTPLDGCPRCGYPYEREPGYFLVSVWIINYGAGSVLGIMIYVIREFFYHPPIGQLILSVIVPIFFFNLLFARHSKALFIALDHYYDPHEKDPGEDGGNLPKPEKPKGGPTAPDKPLPKPKPEPALR
jgi:uncharacterized protein (DUF983 family)